MKSESFFQRFCGGRARFAFAAALLFCAGTLTAPLNEAARAGTRERSDAPDWAALERSAGSGAALGVLGGFRTVIADVAWLRAFHFWEKRDPASCLKFAEIAMTLAPDQTFFLENAANFVAFDFPVWEIRRRGGFQRVSESVQNEIQKRAMNAALRMLDEAGTSSAAGDPQIFLLAAHITLMKTELIFGRPDYKKAAAYYRRACGLAGAPRFAFAAYARIVSEFLPEERAAAKAFLEECRAGAGTPSDEIFFREQLEEYFPEAARAVPAEN